MAENRKDHWLHGLVQCPLHHSQQSPQHHSLQQHHSITPISTSAAPAAAPPNTTALILIQAGLLPTAIPMLHPSSTFPSNTNQHPNSTNMCLTHRCNHHPAKAPTYHTTILESPLTRYDSAASCSASTALTFQQVSGDKPTEISLTRRLNGALLINCSVDFWYFRISLHQRD